MVFGPTGLTPTWQGITFMLLVISVSARVQRHCVQGQQAPHQIQMYLVQAAIRSGAGGTCSDISFLKVSFMVQASIESAIYCSGRHLRKARRLGAPAGRSRAQGPLQVASCRGRVISNWHTRCTWSWSLRALGPATWPGRDCGCLAWCVASLKHHTSPNKLTSPYTPKPS